MPGLRYPGPTITAPCGNYSFLQDAQTSTGKDLAWDRPVARNFEHSSAVEAVPNAPNKYKACRTHQYYAEWMKGMAHSASNSYCGTGCPIIVSPGSQGCNSGRGDNGENDSDDLAAMVDDFIESSGCPDSCDGNDSESGPSSIAKLPDTLQTLTSAHGGIEAELLNAVWNIILTTDVDMLICNSEGADCRGGCIKRLVASQLRTAGFDAAVCKSKWDGSGRVLGGTVQMGEYEYIYVERNYNQSVERLIVDVDFQDQFVLARATPSYLAALKLLPTVFVGSTRRLGQILHIMAEYVKMSLKQNSMPLPPWRTLDFMNSKWLSPNERVVDKSWPCSPRGSSSLRLKGRLASMPETRQCDVQLLRIKDSLIAEVRGTSVNIPGRGRTRQYPTSRAKRSSGIH